MSLPTKSDSRFRETVPNLNVPSRPGPLTSTLSRERMEKADKERNTFLGNVLRKLFNKA